MDYQYAAYTHIGNRDNNDDSYGTAVQNGTFLAVVADGLGGHRNGDLASRLAVDTIIQNLDDAGPDEDTLAYALIKANEAITGACISGLTTVAALWVGNGTAVTAHVGDSRVYQFRDGEIVYQSQDHSMVQLAVIVGEITPEEARHHKDRNKVFRVLGEGTESPKVDSDELNTRPGDRFLLCTDGFWEPVTEDMMLQAAAVHPDVSDWLNSMKELIFDAANPKQDNHTAIVLQIN